MEVPITIGTVKRIVVFVDGAFLARGQISLRAFADCEKDFDRIVKQWKDSGNICLYDGPPSKEQ
jgi:hypothetical protein